MSYPILEYDPEKVAMIEPSKVIQPRDVPEHCVICFFEEVIQKVSVQKNAKIVVENRWEDGPHRLFEIEHHGQRLAYFHSAVGAAQAASLLEEAIAYGCRKFIVCGGCGVLEKGITVGNLIVAKSAVRDEGVSYHYLPPAREVLADPRGVAALEAALKQRGEFRYRLGKTWTTDAPYRETPAKIARRRDEGCLVVEMEAAGLMAVAQFRNAALGQILYSGDDLSGDEWNCRNWQSRQDVREALFWLAAEACFNL
ncbi:nucleoside phosphorylase [candidate division KSB1 bacterium]|nr:nucleoside phosphorylase [candidate division KSB1 bacterium]